MRPRIAGLTWSDRGGGDHGGSEPHARPPSGFPHDGIDAMASLSRTLDHSPSGGTRARLTPSPDEDLHWEEEGGSGTRRRESRQPGRHPAGFPRADNIKQ